MGHCFFHSQKSVVWINLQSVTELYEAWDKTAPLDASKNPASSLNGEQSGFEVSEAVGSFAEEGTFSAECATTPEYAQEATEGYVPVVTDPSDDTFYEEIIVSAPDDFPSGRVVGNSDRTQGPQDSGKKLWVAEV